MKKYFFMLQIFTAASFIVNGQNVGVGTATPEFKLDVRNGSINVDSVYRIGTITILAVPLSGSLYVGKGAGRLNTGLNNTFSGDRAGYDNTTGPHNSFFGKDAGTNNNTGSSNSFFGKEAGALNTTGGTNSFFGLEAGKPNTTGSNNSFFGCLSGSTGSAAANSTTVGYSANVLGNLTNATAIGYDASVDASNKVRIGNTFVTSIGGQVVWTAFSDGRFKYQVQEDVQGIAFIKKLRPVSYQVDLTGLNNYYSATKSEKDKSSSLQRNTNQSPEIVRQTGFIAQEVEQAAKELGFSFSGIDKPQNEKGLYGLRYGTFVVPLVKAMQEQQEIIEILQKQVEAAKTEIPMQIGKQQAMIEQQNLRIEMLIKEIAQIKEKMAMK